MNGEIQHIPVSLTTNAYEIRIGKGILARTGELVADVLKPCRCAVITDDIIGPLHADLLMKSLKSGGFDAHLLMVPAGEASKSMQVAAELCDRLIELGLDRKSAIFSLGGGVVGDLAGFVAAIYYRGIPVIQIPTTVVAQVDSSIGGKTGVNSPLGKNLIGSFHQPRLVIADTNLLSTLPERIFREGLAEAIKHAVIADEGMLALLPPTQGLDLSPLVARNAAIKARIVAEDEYETKGSRALLNFGHTIGHAIESAAGYGSLAHGEAVAIGMMGALDLSVRLAGLPETEAGKVARVIKACSLPTSLPEKLSTESLMALLQRDKKFDRGSIRFVLSRKLGSAFVSDQVSLEDVRGAIERLRK